jgi:subtilisin family serine protease
MFMAIRSRHGVGLLALGLWCGWASDAAAQIRWRSGTSPLSGKTPTEAVDTLASVGLRDANRHLVVQFSEPLTEARRAELAAAGVELLGYLSDNAFFATVAPQGADAAALTKVGTLIDAQPIQRDWKLHPVFVAGQSPTWAVVPAPAESGPEQPGETWIAAYIMFHSDVPAATAWNIAAAHRAVVRQQLFSVNALVIEVPLLEIDALAVEDAVQYVEPALPQLDVVNDSNRALTQANTVQASPYNLTGSGVTVMVYDGGTARSTHVDFQGRLFVRDASGTVDHSTHVAGTIGGAGVANATYKGMAPGVTMQAYGLQQAGGLQQGFLYTNPCDLEADYNEAINTYGAVIANNSIGTNTAPNGFPCDWEGDYGVTDTVIDAIVRGSLGSPFRIVWANGNERNSPARCGSQYHTTAPPACAKNHITVGAVNSNDDSITSFTSWGPADDGRLKPDIAGPGCQSNGDGAVTSCDSTGDTAYTTMCGTSMAAPTVTGLSALLIQDFRAQFPTQPLFRNSTLKAWLAHSAVDRGNAGPDYQFGYGSVRIQAAIDLMRTGAFVENSVSQGATYSRTVVVTAGDPELRVTLAWDDPPGTPNVSPALVNDLDLRVYSPTSVQAYPWTLGGIANPSAAAVRTQANHVDNIEQVLVSNPAAGTWTIQVYGYNVPQGPQTFSLVGDGAVNVGTSISFPSGRPATLAPGTPTQIDVQIASVGETVVAGSPTLYYRYSGGVYSMSALTFISGNLYRATLPAAACGNAPEYYFSAQGSVSGTVYSPATAPTSVYTALVGSITTPFSDNFETDKGWTVGDTGDNATTGLWSRNDPQATTAQPEDDHTAAPGVNCWVTDYRAGTDAGTYDVDNGKTTLKSPTIDMSGATSATVGYWRWYSNSAGGAPNSDVFTVDISNNNGSSWVNAETVGPSGAGTSGGWIYHEFSVSSILTPTSQMKMRFVAADLNTGSLIEAALDDFAVTAFTCTAAATCSDGILNQGETRIDCGGPCPACACTSDAACANGAFCDGAETCDAYGHCQAGSAINCADSVACTTDSCNETTDTCDHVPNNAFCNNGQYCDGVETCNATTGCQAGTAVNCGDGIACTTDTCNETTDTCDHVPNNALCNNGLYCDGVETCNVSLGCQTGALPCTAADWCEEATSSCIPLGNGDFNSDGKVDLSDFADFQVCYGQPAGLGCEPGNLTGSDAMIDAADFAAFVDVLTGP